MKIIYYAPPGSGLDGWLEMVAKAMPEAECRFWYEGDTEHADYALVFAPPAAMLRGRYDLKGIFNLGAGVDAIFQLGDAFPDGVPLIRVDDAGMAIQMAEYVTHALLGYYRRFALYQQQASQVEWRRLPRNHKQDFSVGILGLGVLGVRIADAVRHFEFPLNGWSRTQKDLPGMRCYAGEDGLDAFLRASRVLVCILPLTPETTGIINRENLQKLQSGTEHTVGSRGAYVINVARGGHLVEDDLLALVKTGHIAGATLDVFQQEPLPSEHPYWQEPRITITPHFAAASVEQDTIQQISEKIRALQRGEAVTGVVDRINGY